MSRQKKMDQEFVEAFARRLKMSLSKEDISGREVARTLNLSPETIRRWLNAISMPDSHDLAILCQKYNLSADYLLHGNLVSASRSDPLTQGEAEKPDSKKTRVEELEKMLNHYLEVLDGYKMIIENLKLRVATLEKYIKDNAGKFDEQSLKQLGNLTPNP